MGFRYLFDAGYIDREMDMWFHVSFVSLFFANEVVTEAPGSQERNIHYVVQIEVFLARSFNFIPTDDEDLLYALPRLLLLVMLFLIHRMSHVVPLMASFHLISMARWPRPSLAAKSCRRRVTLRTSRIS